MAGQFERKVGAIIQVRMGSSRLPGKVLKTLPENGHISLLDHILNRIPAEYEAIIATTESEVDDPLLERFPSAFRGSENDVLERFYLCSKVNKLTTIIRLTGDNPFIDPSKMIEVVNFHLENNFDYTRSEGLPLGCNFEVFNFDCLEKAQLETNSLFDREHVTPYLKDSTKFNTGQYIYENYPDLRLTLDYPSDYEMINKIFIELGENATFEHVVDYLRNHPEVARLNAQNRQMNS
ncbi:MAG: hypothetical protein ABJG68_14070 [Crocinitomicaceae bacterium]